MTKNEKGFGAVGFLLVLLIFGLIVGAGWYIWHNQNTDTATQSSQSNDTANHSPQNSEPLSLDSSKLPTGWTAELNESGRILVSNKDLKCFTDVLYTSDTAESNSPDVNHNEQTRNAIKSKGYSVQETQDTLTIVTKNGEKQLEAQALQVTGLDNPMSQKYSYIAKTDSYTQIQLSCPNKTELTAAQSALLAITFTKVD